MTRKFMGAVVALSVAISGLTATQTRAGDAENVARILGAAATLFIIGKAIEQNRGKDHKPKVYTHRPADPLPRVIGRPGDRETGHDRFRAAPLPAQCLLQVDGGGTRYVMGERCLSRNYASARPLPGDCRMQVQTDRGPRPAYSVRCLRGKGYEVAGR